MLALKHYLVLTELRGKAEAETYRKLPKVTIRLVRFGGWGGGVGEVFVCFLCFLIGNILVLLSKI